MARNFSIDQHFIEMGRKHTPEFRFAGKTKQDFAKWQKALGPRVKATLGKMPAKAPLRPEIVAEWEEDGIIKQRIVIDVEAGLSAAMLLFRPAGTTGRLPLILACHGHGPYGKDGPMGITADDPTRKLNVSVHNYAYGLAMAKAGFAVAAIDSRGFGERDDRKKPTRRDVVYDRDICDVVNLRALVMGRTALGMDVSDAMRALDYACGQSFVDAKRVGVMGLSFGGTMTLWMSLCDARIKATDIICYSDRFADFGMRDVNFCGSQVTPGLFALADMPDLQGLIAPRPLLVEMGVNDDCFLIDSSLSCFREVEKIYAAAGAREKLEQDLFEGGHRWGGNKSVEFFNKWL